ncbi:MAG: hypothetical protein L6Q83_08185 [Gammaproteobacteria bacterium]|nr:hypothetical protein [Gammaproteobacteria bacterium]
MASFTDLEREWLDRQRRDYQRLQTEAAHRLFERRFGRPAESVAEIEAAFPSGSIATIDPARHLTEAECMRILSAGSTATGC